jgi:adenine-specific DNA-methyltransferase
MRYLGNKESLLHFIDWVLAEHGVEGARPPDGRALSVCDPFTGTTAVARHMKRRGWRVISGDNMTYSYALQHAYIGLNGTPHFGALLDSGRLNPDCYLSVPLGWVLSHLNNLRGVEGFFYRTYSAGGSCGRLYFTAANALRIDAIRHALHEWHEEGLLTEAERYLLIAALIEAVSRVANIAGTYAAYLKSWDPRAHKPLVLRAPQLVHSTEEHSVNLTDANTLAGSCGEYDLLYIDPPYNSRQYCTNYHLLETLAVGDEPEVKGVAGLRDSTEQKSPYCRAGEAEEHLSRLVESSPAPRILMSYNSEGIMPQERITEILSQRGKVDVYSCEYRRFRSDADGPSRRYEGGNTVRELLYWVPAKG